MRIGKASRIRVVSRKLLMCTFFSLLGVMRHANAADGDYTIGTLNCGAGISIGFLIGSYVHLPCQFIWAPNTKQAGRVDKYDAMVSKGGLDVGANYVNGLSWYVISAQSEIPASLSGTYSGGVANVAILLGSNNVSLSSDGEKIILNPAGLNHRVGIGLSLGVETIVLQALQQRESVTPDPVLSH